MFILGGLLVTATVVVWLSPRLLTHGRWQVLRPRLALTLWHAAFAAGLAAAVLAVVIAVLHTLAVTQDARGASVVVTVLGWIALAIVGGACAMVAVGGGGVGDASRRNRGALLALPHSARALDRRTELRLCESNEVFACSVPDRRGTIVITTGLAALLSPAQLRAVVAHEHAHLTERHHLAMRLADVNSACIPGNAGARRMRRATALLIELIADDRAARTTGAVHLANALVRIADATGDEAMALRAERLSRRSWRPASRLSPVPALYRSLSGDVVT
ncbi:M56 family metallopeptidase [Microbacterium sp.]|uniref:M56 family metallopeptidase n=1 Tax=Microbacterium sp. TaxID=51671 RepID=UPI0009267B60|nr:M56 family metallopeptidase [Microbacterium sp.]MBN9188468.1 M56 family metallopeptidase [Microbacterium sp.]MBN9194084.1 M56 family metallopeptidase [Microbacterium sp.]OJU59889.1 MAG: hypothetical protein BGO04_03550 [Microbacterium sp. 70-38]